MPADAKYLEVAATLEQRLRSGAYIIQDFRSERRLAEEMGVSHMTARKAVQQLLDRGLLQRKPNGRLRLGEASSNSSSGLRIGFIASTNPSITQISWQQSIAHEVAECKGVLRPILFTDPTDAVIFDALASDLDGFFVALPQRESSLLQARLAENRHRTVVLYRDMTHMGIPSIENGPPRSIGLLLDHLEKLGHKHIDALTPDAEDPVFEARIEHWRYGLEQRGLRGTLYRVPAKHGEHIIESTWQHMRRIIRGGEFKATALFCSTTEFSVAAIRAFHDCGMQVSKDVSVCGFGEMYRARVSIPSITVVQPADRTPLIRAALEWIRTHGHNWMRPLRLEPESASIFVGESTGPARVS